MKGNDLSFRPINTKSFFVARVRNQDQDKSSQQTSRGGVTFSPVLSTLLTHASISVLPHRLRFYASGFLSPWKKVSGSGKYNTINLYS